MNTIRNQRHALARGHGFQNVHEQVDRAGREHDRLLLFSVTDVQLQGPVHPAVGRQNLESGSCNRCVLGREWKLPMS